MNSFVQLNGSADLVPLVDERGDLVQVGEVGDLEALALQDGGSKGGGAPLTGLMPQPRAERANKASMQWMMGLPAALQPDRDVSGMQLQTY